MLNGTFTLPVILGLLCEFYICTLQTYDCDNKFLKLPRVTHPTHAAALVTQIIWVYINHLQR